MASGRLAKEQRALALRARRTGTGLATVADQFSLDTRVEFHMVSGVHLGLQEVREFEDPVGQVQRPGQKTQGDQHEQRAHDDFFIRDEDPRVPSSCEYAAHRQAPSSINPVVYGF